MTYVHVCRLIPTLVAALFVVSSPGASAQTQFNQQAAPPPPQNPVCVRLETQLASVERGGGDPSGAAQARQLQDSVNKQQADLDRLGTQSRRLGCQSAGIFSIFTVQPPQCPSLNTQIDQARSAIDRTMSDLQRVQSGGGNDIESQRQGVLMALAQNNCGPQYRAAAAAPQRGIFETIFGGNANYNGYDVSQGGSFRTLCVRTCDGYYYPISFATSPAHFNEDEQTCRNTCPAAEVALYSHRTNEDVRSAATVRGQRYVDLPNAFKYRQAFDSSCSCRRAGQSWADAMGQSQDRTIERGDIIVNDEKSKALSQPKSDAPPPRGRTSAAAPAGVPTDAGQSNPPASDPRPVRSVGPTIVPMR